MKLPFKVRRWFSSLIRVVDGFVFSTRMWWLVRKYGSGDKIPQEVIRGLLGPIDDVTAQSMMFATVLYKICDHYKIDVFNTHIGVTYGDYIQNRLTSEADQEYVMKIITSPCPALEAHIDMLERGDITVEKYRYFGPPAPYETMEAWLMTL